MHELFQANPGITGAVNLAGSILARAIAFLLSPDSSWVTGQVLGVDGGLAHVRR